MKRTLTGNRRDEIWLDFSALTDAGMRATSGEDTVLPLVISATITSGADVALSPERTSLPFARCP